MPLPTYIVPLRDLSGPEAAALAIGGELCRERYYSRTEGLLTATFPIVRACGPLYPASSANLLKGLEKAAPGGGAAAEAFREPGVARGGVSREGVCWGFAAVGPRGTFALYDVDAASLSVADGELLDGVPWCDDTGNPIMASELGRLLPVAESLKIWLATTWALLIMRSGGLRVWRVVRVAGVAAVYLLVIRPDARVLGGANDFSYRFVETEMLLVVPVVVLPALALWAVAEAAWLVGAGLVRKLLRLPVTTTHAGD